MHTLYYICSQHLFEMPVLLTTNNKKKRGKETFIETIPLCTAPGCAHANVRSCLLFCYSYSYRKKTAKPINSSSSRNRALCNHHQPAGTVKQQAIHRCHKEMLTGRSYPIIENLSVCQNDWRRVQSTGSQIGRKCPLQHLAQRNEDVNQTSTSMSADLYGCVAAAIQW